MVLLHTITHPSRLHDVKFCKRINQEGEVLFACAEDKKISIYDISSDPDKIPKIVAEMVGHSNRYVLASSYCFHACNLLMTFPSV